MKNLAGNPECDIYIERELSRAGVEIVRGERRTTGEVPAAVTGRIGPFMMHRAWVYWVVKGPMPLVVARELYADPVGATDVRVAGHCGCPAPDDWAANGIVDMYHIDSEIGLRLFADTVKRRVLGTGWNTKGLPEDLFAEGTLIEYEVFDHRTRTWSRCRALFGVSVPESFVDYPLLQQLGIWRDRGEDPSELTDEEIGVRILRWRQLDVAALFEDAR